MTFRKRQYVRLLLVFLFCTFSLIAVAQEDDSIVSLQGAGTLGNPQFQTLDEMLVSIGISSYHQSNFDGRGVRIGVIDTSFGEINFLQETLRDSITILPEDSLDDYLLMRWYNTTSTLPRSGSNHYRRTQLPGN